jgi:hypothetical protein
MEINLKGFALHVATRQFVQIGLRPDISIVPTPKRNSNNPLGNARRCKWMLFFGRHHNLKTNWLLYIGG